MSIKGLQKDFNIPFTQLSGNFFRIYQATVNTKKGFVHAVVHVYEDENCFDNNSTPIHQFNYESSTSMFPDGSIEALSDLIYADLLNITEISGATEINNP